MRPVLYKHRFVFFLAMLSAGLLLSACSGDDTSIDGSEATAQQAAGDEDDLTKYSGLQLGQGVTPLWPDGQQTGEFQANICHDFDESDVYTSLLAASQATALASSEAREFTFEVTGFLDGTINRGDVTGEARVDVDSFFQQNSQASAFTLVVRVKTIRREYTPDGEVSVRCEQAEEACTLYNNCGTHYVDEQQLGGYLFLSFGLESMSTQVKQELKTELGVSAAKVGEADAMISLARAIVSSESSGFLSYSAFGLPTPKPGEIDDSSGDIEAFLDDALEYLYRVECGDDLDCSSTSSSLGYREAFSAGEVSHDSYGAVISNHLKSYSQSFLDQCGDSEWVNTWSCHNDFYSEAVSQVEDYQLMVDSAQYYLDTSSFWEWGNNATQRQNDVQDLIDQLEQQCIPEWVAASEECHESVDQCTDESVICSVCTPDNSNISNQCRDDEAFNAELQRLVGDLERTQTGQVPPRVRASQDTTSSSPLLLEANDTHYCWMSSIAGRFRGAGEEVIVETDINNSNDDWALDIASTKTADKEKLHGSAFCVNRSVFWDGVNTLDISPMYQQAATGSQTMWSDTYQAALHGMTGTMDETADYIETRENGGSENLEAQATSSALTGYGFSFGVNAPVGGPDDLLPTANFVYASTEDVSKNYSERKMLAPVSDGICVLTKVSGQFDGAGEWARINRDETHWILETGSACDKRNGFLGLGAECDERKPVRAHAECYAYAQD